MYNDVMMDHYRNPRNFGCEGKQSNKASGLHNPSCGDKITVHIQVEGGIVMDICFDGFGCALSTASASLLTEHARGKTVEDIAKLNKDFVVQLLGIPVTPVRLKCALLPLEAIQSALTSSNN